MRSDALPTTSGVFPEVDGAVAAQSEALQGACTVTNLIAEGDPLEPDERVEYTLKKRVLRHYKEELAFDSEMHSAAAARLRVRSCCGGSAHVWNFGSLSRHVEGELHKGWDQRGRRT